MTIDPWILTFSALTVIVTIWMGFWSAKKSKTASDFFVAGRSVSVGWNASAISGEYLSAASFMGVAGMVMSSGYDALWYPVCYACGYLFLLLFIAGPLRRFGAYTIPDFAEGRFDSPLFRKIAVVFVLFIGFFYTMPQMKGAGTTLAYIFPGLPYWAGVVLVGAVITLNVALGGMKGITLVQAFQYWLKMFAISVPVFVLMTVYGHYGEQLGVMTGLRIESSSIDPRVAREQTGLTFVHPIRNIDVLAAAKKPLPNKAPEDEVWLSPFGPLTTKPAKAAAATLTNNALFIGRIPLRADLAPDTKMTVNMSETNLTQALATYAELTGRTLAPRNTGLLARIDDFLGGRLSRWNLVKPVAKTPSGVFYHRDGLFSAIEVKERLEAVFKTNGIVVAPEGAKHFRAINAAEFGEKDGSPAAAVQKAWLRSHEKPLALLYTYSLIIALVCGTAGLPHILVRFYTNPDGVAAKRTTMWVMILIGVFYVFPPVFGVMGRNLLPELYAGTGAKGTDKVVLELPRILNERQSANSQFSILNSQSPSGSTDSSLRIENLELRNASLKKRGIPWGSILSGITCAGAFAAFMSTFSGLLVSLTGALAHDVYGRMLNPKSTPDQRMRMFKVCAVLCGGGAILLGFLVEKFEINKMVGWAFAIAATSYFPLLFLSTWWRGVTMKGAATGMLAGGTLSLIAIASTMFADQALWAKGLADFYAGHPLLRILAEQPAIWALPLALLLMFFVSRLTKAEVPSDIRMKMLVLHAPEKLGLKQEYIQEHQHGH
ncbi:MAG TPA: cation acetate symporter [Verrucomicrobiae bacterium]|nr:cation acetate symporter [Verrucomicrobiae bacterium]